MRRIKCIGILLVLALCLSGCGSLTRLENDAVPLALGWFRDKDGEETADEAEARGPYVAPPFSDSAYHADLAEGNGSARIDLSAVAEGYVAVSAVSAHRLKFQVIKDEFKYNYDIASDGSPSIFPLQCGSGSYAFRVMENIVDSKYAELYSTSREVTLRDEFQPFLRPSDYISYSADSLCVQKAAELAETAGDALGLVSAVYHFVCDTVTYDTVKAQNVRSGYLPDPDETMQSGQGICFDYASLAGAMLRSQGIPTKEIFGYVAPNGLYHAWNMFYTEQTGWVTVSFEVREDTWNRMDLTFVAGGASADFVGDGSNYSDLYTY